MAGDRFFQWTNGLTVAAALWIPSSPDQPRGTDKLRKGDVNANERIILQPPLQKKNVSSHSKLLLLLPLSRLGLVGPSPTGSHGPTRRDIRRRRCRFRFFRLVKLEKREIEQDRAFDHFGQRAIERGRDRYQDGCFVEVSAIGCPCVRIATEIYATRLGLFCCGDT